MPRDVDETILAGHVGTEVASGAGLERGLVRPVHQDHVQAETRDDDASDRLSHAGAATEPGRGGLDRVRLG